MPHILNISYYEENKLPLGSRTDGGFYDYYYWNRKKMEWLYVGNNTVKVKRPYEFLKIHVHTPLTFAGSFIDFLQTWKNKGCVISNLLMKARTWDVYRAEKIPNYIAIREKKGMISYTPVGKELVKTEAGLWSSKNRVQSKPAKFARAFLNPRLVKRLGDEHFNRFASNFKTAEEAGDVTFSLEDFLEGYNSEKCETGDCLGSSCMRNKPVQNFYDFFNAKLLVARRNQTGKICGRAVIWNNVQVVNKKTEEQYLDNVTFMDRVYYSAPEFERMFYDYAEEQKWMVRVLGDPYGYAMDGVKYGIDNYTLRINHQGIVDKKDMFYPYLDTFRYGSYKLPVLDSVYNKEQLRYTFEKTDGTFVDNGRQEGWVLTATNVYKPVEDCIQYEGRYWFKDNDYIRRVEDDVEEQWYYYMDNRIVRVSDKFYLKSGNLVAECQATDTYHLREHIVVVYDMYGKEINVHKNQAYRYTKYDKLKPNKVDISYIKDYDYYCDDFYTEKLKEIQQRARPYNTWSNLDNDIAWVNTAMLGNANNF